MNSMGKTLTTIAVLGSIGLSGCKDKAPEPIPQLESTHMTAPVQTAPISRTPEYRTHTVQEGEWVYAIVRDAYNLRGQDLNAKVREVCALNGMSFPDQCSKVNPTYQLRLPN